MTTTPAGLGLLAVDVAASLRESGVAATTSVDENGGMELVVRLDPRNGQVAAVRAGQWGTAVVHTPGQADRVAFDLLADDACTEHAGCLSMWFWGWVLRHRGTTW